MAIFPHWKLTVSALFHTLIGFSSFYYMSLLNPIEIEIKEFANRSIISHYSYTMSSYQMSWFWSILSSSVLLGEFLGAVWVRFTVDKGRAKTSMLLKNVVLIIAAALHYFSRTYNFVELLLLGRILAGISMMQTLILPLLLTECSPDQFRGVIGTLPNAAGQRLWILIGSVVALPHISGNVSFWYLLALLPIVPAFIHLLSWIILPESPRFLIAQPPTRGQSVDDVYENAWNALYFYHGPNEDPEPILEEYGRDVDEASSAKVGIGEILSTRHYRWPVALSVVCWVVMCLGGIDVAQQYSTEIMISVGVDEKNAQLYTALVLLLPALFISTISSLLSDKIGRKPLLLVGVALMTLGETLLLLSELVLSEIVSVVGLGVIIAGFCIGPAPVSGVLPSELCPQPIRGIAVSLATGCYFLLSYIILICFPPLNDIIGHYVFAPLIVGNFLCLLFLAKFLPETKGQSVWDISSTWRDNIEYEPMLDE